MCHKRSDQTATGVFLIGLAVLFLTPGLGFWPGIMFVLGITAITREISRGVPWHKATSGLWLIGIGLVFAFGFSWPLLLILIGFSMLLGKSHYGHHWGDNDAEQEKRKNEKTKNDKRKNDDDFEEIEWKGDFV